MAKTLEEITADGIRALSEIFDPLILQATIYVERLKQNGQDASNYFDIETGEFINFEKELADRKREKEEAISKMLESLPEEDPETEEGSGEILAAIVEIAKTILKDGIRIKIGDFQYDTKKPFDIQIASLRDEVLKAIGIDPDSDIGRLITDPLTTASDLGNAVSKEVLKAAENTKREVDKAATNVRKETQKGIENAAREATRAIENVAREGQKVLPKITIKKPRWL